MVCLYGFDEISNIKLERDVQPDGAVYSIYLTLNLRVRYRPIDCWSVSTCRRRLFASSMWLRSPVSLDGRLFGEAKWDLLFQPPPSWSCEKNSWLIELGAAGKTVESMKSFLYLSLNWCKIWCRQHLYRYTVQEGIPFIRSSSDYHLSFDLN